jgi:hypothetical protein
MVSHIQILSTAASSNRSSVISARYPLMMGSATARLVTFPTMDYTFLSFTSFQGRLHAQSSLCNSIGTLMETLQYRQYRRPLFVPCWRISFSRPKASESLWDSSGGVALLAGHFRFSISQQALESKEVSAFATVKPPASNSDAFRRSSSECILNQDDPGAIGAKGWTVVKNEVIEGNDNHPAAQFDQGTKERIIQWGHGSGLKRRDCYFSLLSISECEPCLKRKAIRSAR